MSLALVICLSLSVVLSLEAADKKTKLLFDAIPSSNRSNIPVPIVEMDPDAQRRIISVSLMNILVL